MERIWYSIVMRNGEKEFELNGWSMHYGDGFSVYEHDGFPPIALAEMVRGDAARQISEKVEGLLLYATDYNYEEAQKLAVNYYGEGAPGTYLPYDELTMDTPCGNYWC